MSEKTKFFTQQWMQPEPAKLLQKSATANPEFDVHFEELEWHDDGDLVKVRLTFRNCGKNLFTQRLVSFLIKSLHVSK